MEYIFSGCSNLKAIYVGKDLKVSNANTSGMFENCGVTKVTNKSNIKEEATSNYNSIEEVKSVNEENINIKIVLIIGISVIIVGIILFVLILVKTKKQ